ncbi:MAG: hypothetical protein KAG66_18645, partial [Methylococcales bacterium]|nr:hypothetical protein [Methylococcales bacterium]
MNAMKICLLAVSVLTVVGTSTVLYGADSCLSPSEAGIELRNKALGRGINLGNALDAPKEGEWGWSLEANHFDIIA